MSSALAKIQSVIDQIEIHIESNNKQSMALNRAISKPALHFYTSWFCPFAQRVQIALELKQIPYEYIDIDPYNKSKEWLSKNPQGLVPTICHHGNYIYESTVILEYLDDAFPHFINPLFPSNAYQKALNRIWIDHINKKIIKPFYQILQFQDDRKEERDQAIITYYDAVAKLIEQMDESGPYFNGTKVSAVDLVFLPWATRMFLLEHYRNLKYEQCFKDERILNRYDKWYNACNELGALKATQKSKTITFEQYPTELIKKYKRYADNTANSLVAKAINSGSVMP